MPAPTVEEKVSTDSSTTVDPKEAVMKDANQAATETTAEAKGKRTSVVPVAKPTSDLKPDKDDGEKKSDAAQAADAGSPDSSTKEESGTKSHPKAKPARNEEMKVSNGGVIKSSGSGPETNNSSEEKKGTEAGNGNVEMSDTDAANGSVEQDDTEGTETTAGKTGDGSEVGDKPAKSEGGAKLKTDGDAKVDGGDQKKSAEDTPAPTNGKEADSTKGDDIADREDQEKKGASAKGEKVTAKKGEVPSKDHAEPQKVRFGAVEERIEEEEEEYKPDEDEDEDGEADEEDEDEEGEIVEGDEAMVDLDGIPESLATTLFEKGGVSGLLHAHASKGDIDEIRKLLAKGGEMDGKVDDRDVFQYTPLHVAVENDKKDVCEVLLEFGADISAATKLHESKPIHYAAFEGHDEIIDLLLQKGADINSLTDDGRTPLYQAAMRGHDHCVKLLLERGADRELADKNDKKPEDVGSKKAVVDLFVAPPAKKARTE